MSPGLLHHSQAERLLLLGWHEAAGGAGKEEGVCLATNTAPWGYMVAGQEFLRRRTALRISPPEHGNLVFLPAFCVQPVRQLQEQSMRLDWKSRFCRKKTSHNQPLFRLT